MPYLFVCPHCSTQTQVDDQFSGHHGQCVECRGEIAVPHFAATETSARSSKGPTGRFVGLVAASLAVLALAVVIVIGGIRIGGRSLNRLADARVRSGAMSNLEKIALAMNNYAADHGSYPPPVVRDPAGRPMHSWRMMLLPYLGEDKLYNSYDRNLPWDDPSNLVLQWEIPTVYLHPNSGAGGWSAQSAYYLITGVGTLFPPSGPLGPDRMFDRASQTILIVEASPMIPSGSWLEPIDLDYAAMTGDLLGGGSSEIGGLSENGAAIATVDARGHFLSNKIAPTTLQSLVTPNGGEPLPDDVLD